MPKLPLAGRTVTVEAVEAFTAAATRRRLANRRPPDVVDTDAFRAILGAPGRPISRARLYQLRDNPDFPRPISAGVWLRTSAEHYAETRNRRAGRPTTPRRAGDRTYCAECLHDAATHGIDTDYGFNGTPDDGAPCGSVVIEDGRVLDHPCDCAGYRPSPAA